MIAATGLYTVLEAGVIVVGITIIAGLIATTVVMAIREEKDRSIVPWGARGRVERARAMKEIAELRVEEEAAEIKHLALQPVRNKVQEAIRNDETVNIKELLAGPSKIPSSGAEMREAAWKE